MIAVTVCGDAQFSAKQWPPAGKDELRDAGGRRFPLASRMKGSDA